MNSYSDLNREGSQLWNPTSQELTAHAADLAKETRHLNNFPPSRHCTEQFTTGPAGPNAGAMIDFTAPDVRQQIEDSKEAEFVQEGRGFGEYEDHDATQGQQAKGPRQIHNPYSVNQVFLKVDPETAAPEFRQQSDYFPEIQKQRQEKVASSIVAFNDSGIIFMPPRPPSIESFDVFVKGGADPEFADRMMTGMIYRWYSLCSVNVVTYKNWYALTHGGQPKSDNPLVNAPPPNPANFVDLSEWYFEAEKWWTANFAERQALRHHSRSAAIAAGSAAPLPTHHNGANRGTVSPSKRAPAVPIVGGAPTTATMGPNTTYVSGPGNTTAPSYVGGTNNVNTNGQYQR